MTEICYLRLSIALILAFHQHMSAAEYVDKVAKRELYDATLTFQLDNGFEARGVLEDYIEEPALDNCAALIVWENPDYQPQSA